MGVKEPFPFAAFVISRQASVMNCPRVPLKRSRAPGKICLVSGRGARVVSSRARQGFNVDAIHLSPVTNRGAITTLRLNLIRGNLAEQHASCVQISDRG